MLPYNVQIYEEWGKKDLVHAFRCIFAGVAKVSWTYDWIVVLSDMETDHLVLFAIWVPCVATSIFEFSDII